eukprot:scaffold26214_cov29-Tisochrysis_lutea.AAC.2
MFGASFKFKVAEHHPQPQAASLVGGWWSGSVESSVAGGGLWANPWRVAPCRSVVAKLVSSLGTTREGVPAASAALDSSGKTGTGSSGEQLQKPKSAFGIDGLTGEGAEGRWRKRKARERKKERGRWRRWG